MANQFISGGIHLGMTPSLLALGVGLSVMMGTLGGLYPAWRARLVPMDAIRLGRTDRRGPVVVGAVREHWRSGNRMIDTHLP